MPPKILKVSTSANKHIGVSHVPFKEPDIPKRQLSEARRRRLEEIRDRENMRCKRERVGKILIRKLVIKFGSIHRSVVQSQVTEFMAVNELITAELIAQLEKQIQAEIIKAQQTPQSLGSDSQSQAEQAKGDSTGNQQAAQTPPEGNEWAIMGLYQSILNEKKDRQEKELHKLKKIKFKEALDQQIRVAKELKAREGEDVRAYEEFVRRDIKLFHESEEAKRSATKKKHEEELRVRRQQIEEQARRREEDQQGVRQAEEASLRQARAKVQREQDALRATKQRELEIRQQIERSNEENREKRRVQHQQEVDEDNRLMREYAARLDREAFERDNAFKKRMEGIDSSLEKFESHDVVKQMKEDRLRAERQLLAEQDRKEAADLAKLQQQEEARRKKAEEANRENARLLDWKRRLDELERKESDAFASKFRDQNREFLAQEQENRRKKKEQQHNYRHVLTSQVLEHSSADGRPHGAAYRQHGSDAMESRVRALNMPELKKAVEELPADLVLSPVPPPRRPHTAFARTSNATGSENTTGGGRLW